MIQSDFFTCGKDHTTVILSEVFVGFSFLFGNVGTYGLGFG